MGSFWPYDSVVPWLEQDRCWFWRELAVQVQREGMISKVSEVQVPLRDGWALLLRGRTIRASWLDTEMHEDSDIRPLVIVSKVGMTSWGTSDKSELRGIDLPWLFLQAIFDLNKDARNDIAPKLLIPEKGGYIKIDHLLAVRTWNAIERESASQAASSVTVIILP